MNSGRKSCHFGRDTVYRLKNSLHINWQRFITLLSARLITETIQPLTSENRKDAFIIDDTIFERGRSRQVELLAWKHDHARHKTERGFQLLTLSWSDGVTQIPVNFCLSSSANAKKRINEAKNVPPNSAAAHRRRQAKMYLCDGKRLNCKEIYAANKKRRGRSKYLLSVNVKLPYQPEKGSNGAAGRDSDSGKAGVCEQSEQAERISAFVEHRPVFERGRDHSALRQTLGH